LEDINKARNIKDKITEDMKITIEFLKSLETVYPVLYKKVMDRRSRPAKT